MVNISIKQVREYLKTAASKFISTEEAEYFADQEIELHLKKSLRVNPLEEAIKDLENWSKHENHDLDIEVDKGASMLINFKGLAPSLKLKYVHDELEKKAKANGIAFIGVNNSAGFHSLTLWTEGLAKRNLVAFCSFNGGPLAVVPFNGTKGLFGTNPISYVIPTEDNPISSDMATSEIPYFEIMQAKKNNTPLRPNSAVDNEGNVTTDVSKAMDEEYISNLLPMGGGYKGFNLVLLTEILTGSLVRSLLSNEQDPGYVSEEHGGFIIAIDIATFTDVNKFKKSVSSLTNVTREQKPAQGKTITIPGDQSMQRMNEILEKGTIEIDEGIIQRLEALIK